MENPTHSNSLILPGSDRSWALARALGVFAILGLYTLLLNHSVLAGHWRWDDPSILLHLHRFPILGDFIRPEVWQQFSPANLTPWLPFSFDIDLHLFGLNPGSFYGHQLLALSAAAFALYRCLGLWVAPPYAFFGAILFLSSTPSLLVAQQLMTRHYVEGGVFALLALYGFVSHLRAPNRVLWYGSIACFVLAVTAKEVYVPLVVLLLFLPEANLTKRIAAAIPFAAVVVVYALWRAFMLSSLTGGYVAGGEVLGSDFLGGLASSYANFPALLFGPQWPIAVGLLVALFGSYGALKPARLLPGLCVALLSLLPLAPLTGFPGIGIADRYLFVVVIVLSSCVAISVDFLTRLALEKQQRVLATCVVVGAAVVASLLALQGRTVSDAVALNGSEFDRQAEFIWEHDEQSAFFPSASLLPSYWFVVDLSIFKQSILPGSSVPLAIPDEIYLSESINAVYAYSPACDCMQADSESVAQKLAEHRRRLRGDAPLSLEFTYESGYFSWEFGPYPDGDYRVVSDVLGVIPAPRTGRLRVNLGEDTPFYLRYTSPEGWMTYSSLQRVRADAPTTQWQRE